MQDALRYAHELGSPLQTGALETEDWMAEWTEPWQSASLALGEEGDFIIAAPPPNSQGTRTLTIMTALSELRKRRTRAATIQERLREHVAAKRAVYELEQRQGWDVSDGLRWSQLDIERLVQNVSRHYSLILKRGTPSRDSATNLGADTEGLVVTDHTGTMIALTTSLGTGFGSGVCKPSLGFCLHGRGYGFALDSSKAATPGHVFGPGKRPWHTLMPVMLYSTQGTRASRMAVATKGGARSPYAISQFLLSFFEDFKGSPAHLAEAIGKARFRDQFGQGAVEFEGFKEGLNSTLDMLPPASTEFEDSGFAVIHAIVAMCESDPCTIDAMQVSAATDLAHKPGSAIVREVGGYGSTASPLDVAELDAAVKQRLGWFDRQFPDWLPKQITLGAIQFPTEPGTLDAIRNTSQAKSILANIVTKYLEERKRIRPGVCLGAYIDTCAEFAGAYEIAALQYFGSGAPVSRHLFLTPHGPDKAFPLGRIGPVLGATRWMSGIEEDKGSWAEWLNVLGFRDFLPSSARLGAIRMARERIGRLNDLLFLEELKQIHQLSFPMVLKVPGIPFGKGVWFLKNLTGLSAVLDDETFQDVSILQQMVYGTEEVTINLGVYAGRIINSSVFVFSHKTDSYIKGAPEKYEGMRTQVHQLELGLGGLPTLARGMAKNIAASLGLSGLMCIQYKGNGHDRVKLMEVHQRACNSLSESTKEEFLKNVLTPHLKFMAAPHLTDWVGNISL
eukprot:TRINITY_DN92258_c0_g1_i1.p1 TRINITY_DN92258_c0_g1~~TRINITY_DN92258_c0_g1_i1.p1  ORF type:complete len:773 (+),score=115.22 TRINITY_DN92258_c0_g1_i1:125-2320(+)